MIFAADAGVLDTAERLNQATLDSIGDVARESFFLADDVVAGAFDFGRDALAANRDASQDFTFSTLQVFESALDFGRGVVTESLGVAEGSLRASQDTVEAIGLEQVTSEASRVQQLGIAAVVAFALIIIVPQVFK